MNNERKNFRHSYDKLSIRQLKQKLKAKSQKTKGHKRDLVRRTSKILECRFHYVFLFSFAVFATSVFFMYIVSYTLAAMGNIFPPPPLYEV
jgi:hypothetical protein